MQLRPFQPGRHEHGGSSVSKPGVPGFPSFPQMPCSGPPQYVTLQLEAHLNTCFKRYVYFVAEFDLVEAKELAPLQQLISSLLPSE